MTFDRKNANWVNEATDVKENWKKILTDKFNSLEKYFIKLFPAMKDKEGYKRITYALRDINKVLNKE